jgi:hypothetical protein
VPQGERDHDQRGEHEARRQQWQRVGDLDGQHADDVAGAPEQDEHRQDDAIGHDVTVPPRAATTRRALPAAA